MTNKWHKRFFEIAKCVSTWSKDPSTQIGAVIVDNNRRILSTGYNGFPRNIDDKSELYLNREIKYQYILHAEINALFNALYNGVSVKNSIMYVWGLPMCSECAKGIIQSGILEVYWSIDDKKQIPEKWIESFKLTEKLFNKASIIFKNINYEKLT